MERDGLRSLSGSPRSTFDPNPETFVAIIARNDDYFEITFPDLREVFIDGRPGDDEGELAVRALDEAVLARLVGGDDIPAQRFAQNGEVDVPLSPNVGNRLRTFRLYGRQPKS